MGIYNDFKRNLNESVNETDLVTRLKQAFPDGQIFNFEDEIDIILRSQTGEIHGKINVADNTAKLTSPSGPNPLEPSTLSMFNTLAGILDGFKMLHY